MAEQNFPIPPSTELAEISPRPRERRIGVNRRVLLIAAMAMFVAAASSFVAQALIRLIGLITNISFYGRISSQFSSPAANHLGAWVIVIPVIGGILVGLMARYGHVGIRGHGIPEAMEQVLTNQSRVSPWLTILKPLSAAIAIGTGGPFGAEGPIIATGGALGSLLGQLTKMTARERKTLLAAGAAAGMAATFGSPVSAVLLAIELLLFEYRADSFIPVALASTVATGIRMAFTGANPIFAMPEVMPPSGPALASYMALGVIMGLASVAVTRALYKVEDLFDELPVHWMWWPAIGAVAVGLAGYLVPRTLGVGYDNIDHILGGTWAWKMILALSIVKFISWAISLGSGTSGGTLAPLFTIGGGLGAVIGVAIAKLAPEFGVDPRVAALVGMSALFAGASRAPLASVVFAFETTLQPLSLLPLLGGCSVAYLVSSFFMRNTIMTEKIVRRGIAVPSDYVADFLSTIFVKDAAVKPAVTLDGDAPLSAVRAWLASGVPGSGHQGYPVIDPEGHLLGVLTRRDLLERTVALDTPVRQLIKRAPIVIYEDSTLREAADLMVQQDIGRLPVVRGQPRKVVGMLTRSNLLTAHRRRLRESTQAETSLRIWPAS